MSIPHRFIVVDDDPVSNMICKFNLQTLDAEVEIDLFTEPEEALEKIESICSEYPGEHPVVLFLDLNMPSMTGWEFLEELAEAKYLVPDKLIVYILSSSLDEGDLEKASGHPLLSGFISKPLTPGALKQKLSER